MKTLPSVSRDAKQICDRVMLSLATCYKEFKPGSTTKDFIREVMDMVMQKDNPSVIDPVEILAQFLSPEETAKGIDWVATQPVGPMLISAAFCARARVSLNRGLQELTWINTADAMFWCGAANSRNGINAHMFKTMTQARAEGEARAMSESAKSGAIARSDAWQPIREFVFQYARRPEIKWDSRSHAADVIAKATLKFREEQDAFADTKEESTIVMQKARDPGKHRKGVVKVVRLPQIKAKSFVRTVDGWLKTMPDAVRLFPSSKTPR